MSEARQSGRELTQQYATEHGRAASTVGSDWPAYVVVLRRLGDERFLLLTWVTSTLVGSTGGRAHIAVASRCVGLRL